MTKTTKSWIGAVAVVLAVLAAVPASAIQMKQGVSSLDSAALIDSTIRIQPEPASFDVARANLPAAVNLAWQSFNQANPMGWDVRIDQVTGLPALAQGRGIPMLAGGGSVAEADAKARTFLNRYAGILNGVSINSLTLDPAASRNDDGNISLVYNWNVNGIPVEGALFVMRFSAGKMIQFGATGIGPIPASFNPVPSISSDFARENVFAYAGGFDDRTDEIVDAGSLRLYPTVHEGPSFSGARFGLSLRYDVRFRRDGQVGTWLGQVDAGNGNILEFRDGNHYGVVKGGVYPGTATGKGTEINIPLPYADYGTSTYSNAGGVYSGTTGTSALSGKYFRMVDSCGSISKAADGTGLIDFGTSSGTDCTTPGTGGAGNTHASRSGYFWLTAINEKARGYLSSSWLNTQVRSNMNLNQTCNAYWNGSTVNFFKSGGGCGNTGEIVGIFLHEWGHGMDSNDGVAPTEMSTGEAMGDTTALTMTHVSCVGAGFLSSNCSGYGDACTNCTGVRDIDYTKHAGNAPWTRSTVLSKCPTSSSYAGPWGREGHCESLVASMANWDLSKALVAKYGDAGWLVFDKIWFGSRSSTGSAYSNTDGGGGQYGCGSTNWYPAYLAANDDDGNLSNGTPDANEIYNAFAAHSIACNTQNHTSTKTGASIATPTGLTANGSAGTGALSWTAASGATSYAIYRNTFGATYGYTKVGTTTGTSYTDTAVANGTTYYYAVQGLGSGTSNFSQLVKTSVTVGGTAPTTYSISGSAGTAGAVVTAGSASATADASGNYSISGLSAGTYTVSASKTGCTFSPTSQSVTVGPSATGKNFTASCTSTDIALTSGVTRNGDSVAQGAWVYYYIDVPSGASNLTIATTNATGDIDIYTQFNTKPTSSAYTCRPYTGTGNESCSQANPSAGRWYLGVYGYAAGSYSVTATVTTGTGTTYSIAGNAGTSGVTVSAGTKTATSDASGNYSITGLAAGTYSVTASKSGCTFSPTSISVTVGPNATGKNFTATCGSGDTALTSGVAVTGQSVAQGAWKYFYISVPSGASNLTLATTSATGDVDIYTQFGTKPTSSAYVCRPYTSNGNESCSQANPTAGTWWIGVYGYAAATFTVTGTVTTGGGGGTQTERLTNGGFEAQTTSGNTTPDGSWTVSTTGTTLTVITANGANPKSGTDYAYMGVNNSASQTLTSKATTTIPSTATAATLSFWVSIVTSETGTTAYDKLKIELLNSSGTVLATLATLSNANSTGGASTYVQKSYNVTSYKGQAVRVRFTATMDGSVTTAFRIDDVSVKSD